MTEINFNIDLVMTSIAFLGLLAGIIIARVTMTLKEIRKQQFKKLVEKIQNDTIEKYNLKKK